MCTLVLCPVSVPKIVQYFYILLSIVLDCKLPECVVSEQGSTDTGIAGCTPLWVVVPGLGSSRTSAGLPSRSAAPCAPLESRTLTLSHTPPTPSIACKFAIPPGNIGSAGEEYL